MSSYPPFGTSYRNPYNHPGYPNWDTRYQPFPGQANAQPTNQPNVPFIPPTPEDTKAPLQSTKPPKKKDHTRSKTLPGTSKVLKFSLKRSKPREPPAEPAPVEPETHPQHHDVQPRMRHPRVHLEDNDPQLASSSSPTYAPDQQQHLYVAFQGDDELRISFCSAPAIEEIRRTIFPFWPDGVAEEEHVGWEWRIRFNSLPWKSQSIAPHILIVKLFELFAQRGYAVQGAINISSSTNPPKFVFVATHPLNPQFFALYLSRKSTRATIVMPPPELQDLEPKLRRRIGSKLRADRSIDSTLRILEIEANENGEPVLDPTEFLMQLMSSLAEIGFDFDACIPLGKKRMSPSPRREVLIFRSTQKIA